MTYFHDISFWLEIISTFQNKTNINLNSIRKKQTINRQTGKQTRNQQSNLGSIVIQLSLSESP